MRAAFGSYLRPSFPGGTSNPYRVRKGELSYRVAEVLRFLRRIIERIGRLRVPHSVSPWHSNCLSLSVGSGSQNRSNEIEDAACGVHKFGSQNEKGFQGSVH